MTLETGVVAGTLLVLAGLGISIWAVSGWENRAFGELDPRQSLRLVVPATLALMLGFQTILSSFFLSVLGLSRRRA